MVDADQISVSDLYKMVSTLTAFRCVSDVCIFIPEAVNRYNILCWMLNEHLVDVFATFMISNECQSECFCCFELLQVVQNEFINI